MNDLPKQSDLVLSLLFVSGSLSGSIHFSKRFDPETDPEMEHFDSQLVRSTDTGERRPLALVDLVVVVVIVIGVFKPWRLSTITITITTTVSLALH